MNSTDLTRPKSSCLNRSWLALLSSIAFASTSVATTLPVGPNTFGTDADYDRNFKESSFNGVSRNSAGYLEVLGVPTATAAFDISSTGGLNGQGGTGGNDINNDLTNFTISADVASSVAGGIGAGFLLRMNNSEAGGYVALMHTQGTGAVTFDLGKGSGLNGAGVRIFSTTVPLSGLTTAANTFYNFSVDVSGDTFFFNFGLGAAKASYTDSATAITVGQVGITMDTFSPTAATRMDNFTIVPEPHIGSLLLCSGLGYLAFRRTRRHA